MENKSLAREMKTLEGQLSVPSEVGSKEVRICLKILQLKESLRKKKDNLAAMLGKIQKLNKSIRDFRILTRKLPELLELQIQEEKLLSLVDHLNQKYYQ